MSRPLTSIQRFLGREDGAIAIEAAIILPLLGFAYVAGFAYFDNYRREALLTKATYTVADILSRETGVVTANDFEGMQDIFEFLTFSEGQTRLRFTQIERVAGELVISSSVPGVQDTYATDGTVAMTEAQLETIRHRIPRLEDGQVIVLTESFTIHEPIFDVGLTTREFHRVAPTRNRVVDRLVFDPTAPDPVESTPVFDPTDLPAPTITLFDTVALLNAPDPIDPPIDGSSVEPVSSDDPDGSDDGSGTGSDDGSDNGNNGHGNDTDGNDDSNPGASNDPDDDTDDDGTPGNSGKDKKNGNNGHGNDADGNDNSNPGASNDPDDDTDDDGTPGNSGSGSNTGNNGNNNGNNGHGNDPDGNDDSNPGASNDPDDDTDADGTPGKSSNTNGKNKTR